MTHYPRSCLAVQRKDFVSLASGRSGGCAGIIYMGRANNLCSFPTFQETLMGAEILSIVSAEAPSNVSTTIK